MADYGLIGGFAEGVKAGLNTYRDAKQQAFENAIKQRAQQFQELEMKANFQEHGLIAPPEGDTSTDLQYTPEKKSELDSKLRKQDVNSDVSQQTRDNARAILDAASPGLSKKINLDKMSAQEIEENKLYQSAISGGFGAQAKTALAGAMNARTEAANTRGQQTTAANESDKIQNDPIIKQGQQNVNAALRGKSLITPKMTIQDANTVAADLGRLVQGGNPAQGTIHEQQYNTAYGKVMGLLQSIKGTPEDAVPEDIKQAISAKLDELAQVTKQGMSARAQNRIQSSQAALKGNPYAENALGEIKNQYVLPDDNQGLIKPPANGLMQVPSASDIDAELARRAAAKKGR